jgi:hypothetical protein
MPGMAAAAVQQGAGSGGLTVRHGQGEVSEMQWVRDRLGGSSIQELMF